MPNNVAVIDVKPLMSSVEDIRPNNNSVFGETSIYLEEVTLAAGMWMGFGALTYPTAITIEKARP